MHSRVLSLYDVHDTDARTRQRTLFQYVRGGSSRAADQAARARRAHAFLRALHGRVKESAKTARGARRAARALAHLKDDNEYLRSLLRHLRRQQRSTPRKRSSRSRKTSRSRTSARKKKRGERKR